MECLLGSLLCCVAVLEGMSQYKDFRLTSELYSKYVLLMYMLWYKYILVHIIVIHVPYKTIYWRGINIGDWLFYVEIANIKSTIFVSI